MEPLGSADGLGSGTDLDLVPDVGSLCEGSCMAGSTGANGGSSSLGVAALTLRDILPVGALAAAVNLEESG